MNTPVRNEIHEIESLRKQIFWWRTGATLVTAAVVVGCLLSLNDAVRGLAQDGPRQKEFVGYVSTGLQKEVMPNIQTLASQTLTEIQPQVRQEFARLNDRVPELTAAVQKELKTLQDELPKTSEKTLDDAFGNLVRSRESKIKAMYPDVTEDQLKTLVTNLTNAGEAQVRQANAELFAPHQAALGTILDDMRKIAATEPPTPKGQDPTWEMGLAVLDVVRADLKDAQTGAPTGIAPAGSPAKTTAKGGKA